MKGGYSFTYSEYEYPKKTSYDHFKILSVEGKAERYLVSPHYLIGCKLVGYMTPDLNIFEIFGGNFQLIYQREEHTADSAPIYNMSYFTKSLAAYKCFGAKMSRTMIFVSDEESYNKWWKTEGNG